jgi:hypothetical protein
MVWQADSDILYNSQKLYTCEFAAAAVMPPVKDKSAMVIAVDEKGCHHNHLA